jgi:hypothetical protein
MNHRVSFALLIAPMLVLLWLGAGCDVLQPAPTPDRPATSAAETKAITARVTAQVPTAAPVPPTATPTPTATRIATPTSTACATYTYLDTRASNTHAKRDKANYPCCGREMDARPRSSGLDGLF